MELSHVWRAVVRYWLVALATFGVFLVAAAYLAYSPADRYQATATLLVEPSDVNSLGNVSVVSFLLPALQVQLGTADMQRAAAAGVSPTARRTPVGVSSSVDPGTGILRVMTASSTPRAVAPWANAYARALIASQESTSALRITMIDPAVPPGGPSGPARSSTLVSGAVLGLIAAIAAALIAEAIVRRRYLASEIRRRFDIPVIGEIPRIRGDGRAATATHVLRGEEGLVVESVMRARANLESQLATRRLSSLCVTSLEADEGKSTLVSTLAWALAWAGHDVTAIEADLRYPSLQQEVVPTGARTAPADLGVVVASASSSPSVRFVAASDLVALAEAELLAPRGAMHPAEVVTIALPLALQALDRPSATILVDTPALRRAAEASVAARVASGVLVVVDVSRRRVLDRLEQAVQRVDEAGGSVVGVVLNRTSSSGWRRRAGADDVTRPSGGGTGAPRTSHGVRRAARLSQRGADSESRTEVS